MAKYKVECQALVTIFVDAEDKDDACEKADQELHDMDDIDWAIYAYNVKGE